VGGAVQLPIGGGLRASTGPAFVDCEASGLAQDQLRISLVGISSHNTRIQAGSPPAQPE
jgi:hypothetical protein